MLLAFLVFVKVLEPNENWAWKTPKELSSGLQEYYFSMILYHRSVFLIQDLFWVSDALNRKSNKFEKICENPNLVT